MTALVIHCTGFGRQQHSLEFLENADGAYLCKYLSWVVSWCERDGSDRRFWWLLKPSHRPMGAPQQGSILAVVDDFGDLVPVGNFPLIDS